MKKRRLALFHSFIALLLCLSMLVGTTFAWFTDYVVTGINTIAAGVLDVQLHHSNAAVKDEQVDSATKLFMDLQGKPILWEPGVVSYENLRITNAGDLALVYQLSLSTANENFVVDASGAQYGLSQILKVGFVEGGITATDRDGVVASVEATDWTTLADFVQNGSLLPEGAGESEEVWGIVIYWQPGENDNFWNLNNGKTLSEGDVLSIDLGVHLIATQEQHESDSFGNDYDATAKTDVFPVFVASGSVTTPITPNDQNQVAADTLMTTGQVSASIPAGVQLAEGTTELTMSVTEMDASGANITLGENEAARSLDVHIDGIDATNTVAMVIDLGEIMPVGLNEGNVKLYHVEDGATNEMARVGTEAEVDAHNEFFYDPATGRVVVAMASFSELLTVADTVNAWNGDFDYSWYNASETELTIANADQLAGFGAIVGGMDGQTQDSFSGKTVKLICDINLGDAEETNDSNLIFHPIGYWNNEGTYERKPLEERTTAVESGLYAFQGTFDGQGHVIANFYQNTWEIKGDHNWYDPITEQYYRDGMGLFGKVYGGTVKNLTVSNFSSDGEIATTGVIAAYAEGATFENISIFNCNPRVYNIGNGGIVGCVGWYAKEEGLKTTFTNITVDNSNKISALWGSYDVACGGIVGQYYPTSGQSSANYPENAGIHFENCHVSAIMDVYNDVCANYQYYAYRYAGMMIGSIRQNTTNEDGKTIPDMTGISATGCTVNYGDWNDYYYCEFEKNSMASYSEDYQFSRVPHSELNFTDSNGNGVVDADERASVTGCKHTHTAEEDKQAIYLPFHQLFTGYGWGVSSIGLEKYSGIVTNLDITEGDQEESVEKFVAKLTDDSAALVTNTAYSIGDLFAEIADIKPAVNDAAVQVSVSAVNNSDITAEYAASTTGNWEDGTLTFNKIEGLCTVTIQDYNFCKPTTFVLKDGKLYELQKFAIVFPNVDSYLYRVGNLNAIKLSSLFEETGFVVDDANVSVTVTDTSGGDIPECVFTPNTTAWENGELDFNSYTGLAKITISEDGNFEKTLDVEVITANNATDAASATTDNVVLLNDCGFSSIEVSNGYSLYGNGFTMTCGSDSYASDFGYAFVTLSSGTLDNVQIVCPNFDYAALYKSNLTSTDNRSYTTDAGKTYYYNARSGVMVSGNSQILNSRISGGRAAVNVTSGNVVIDNSRIELGAVASILIGAANQVTLRDVTLIQKPTVSTYDSSKTLMGFSVLMVCNSNGDAAPVYLEGNLTQNAWVDENDAQYVPSAGQSIIENVLANEEYKHDLDGDGTRESLNLGFAYMPESVTSAVNKTTITDYRTNKDTVPYDYAEVSILNGKTYVYSYKYADNESIPDNDVNTPNYSPDAYGDTVTVSYSDAADGLTFEKSYGTDGWVYELNVDLDKLSGYTLDFSKLSMSVNGVTVSDFKINNDSKPTSPVEVIAGGTTYTLTATVDSKEHTAYFKVTGTETTKDSPSLVASNYEAALLVGEAGSTFSKDTWHGAAPVLNGIQIRYWSVAEKQYKTITLSDYTPTTAGKQNGTEAVWTYTPTNGDFTLTIKNETAVHSSNSVYAMPVVVNSKLYFVASGSNGLVNYGNSARTIKINYYFKDNNGGEELKFDYTWSIECANGNTCYDYSDFCSGTSKTFTIKSSNGSGCVTGNTLVTLADGSQKRIDQVTYNDQLLVWNFYAGEYAVAPAACIWNHGYNWNNIIKLTFGDGTVTNAVNEHGYFDTTLNEFVMITPHNATEYLGHEFVKADGDSYTTTTLVDVEVSQEYIEAYSILTAYYYNFTTDNMFSLTSPVIETNFFMPFEVGENMTFDVEKMANDIAEYGLYEYADFEGQVPESVFDALNIKYLKVAVGKGLITYEEIIELLYSEGVIE